MTGGRATRHSLTRDMSPVTRWVWVRTGAGWSWSHPSRDFSLLATHHSPAHAHSHNLTYSRIHLAVNECSRNFHNRYFCPLDTMLNKTEFNDGACPPEKEKRATVRAQGRLRFREISLMALLLLSLPLLGSKGKLSPGRRHHSGYIYLYTFSNNKFALLWGEAQKKIAYCYPKVT